MPGLIVEVSPVSKNSTIAHVRNVLEINKKLKWDICWDEKTFASAMKKKYKKILFSYSSKFALHKGMKKLLDLNPDAELFWMVNEYNGSVPKCLRDSGNVTVIANHERIPTREYGYVKKWHSVDLNLIIWGEIFKTQKKYDCVYYGTFRPNREKYFVEYLQKPIILSSSRKNHKQFQHIGCNPVFADKFSWKKNAETLRLFRYSLIIEDVHTNTHYSHLPNRFFEAVFCGCVPLFDKSCKRNVEISGYKIPEFLFFDNFDQMKNFIENDDFEKTQESFFSAVYDDILKNREKTFSEIYSILEEKNA